MFVSIFNNSIIANTNIFRGICIYRNTIIPPVNIKNQKDLLKIKETKKAKEYKQNLGKKLSNTLFFKGLKKFRNKLAKYETPIKIKQYKTRYKLKKNKFNELKRLKSFSHGYTYEKINEREYEYFSEDEEKLKIKSKKMKSNFHSLWSELAYLNEKELNSKLKELKFKAEKKKKIFLSKRHNEDTPSGSNLLLQEYNENRGKVLYLNLDKESKKQELDQEKEVKENLVNVGKALLQKLQIFRVKEDPRNYLVDYDKFYGTNEKKAKIEEGIIHQNIMKYDDTIPKVIKLVNKTFPDLIAFNIPKILQFFPKLERREFFEIFIQFKILLLVYVCMKKDLKLVNKGLDFNTFYNCVNGMKTQGKDFANKIFDAFNHFNFPYLTWQDFLKGMLIMKSDDIEEKIDIFFKILDSDGNGLLSYDEVFDLSVVSLQRTFGASSQKNEEEVKNIIEILAKYFATLIFKLVNIPLDEEIPLELIKEKIIEGKSEADYLEMFICADIFT